MKEILPRSIRRSHTLALFMVGQAGILFLTRIATLWWSQDLTLWLIHQVGEQQALGAKNVVYPPGGGILLTNPSAMVCWIAIVWAFGILQILAAGTVLMLWVQRPRRQSLES